jgi:hypothetical protein
MSKLSKLNQDKEKTLFIIPGKQTVSVISVEMLGGNAQQLLTIIGTSKKGQRIEREFPSGWCELNGVLSKQGILTYVAGGGDQFPLQLQLGSRSGLALRDAGGKQRSLVPIEEDEGMVINVGAELSGFDVVLGSELESFANQLVAWVVHGSGWKNRSKDRQQFDDPYGKVRAERPYHSPPSAAQRRRLRCSFS